MVACLGVPVPSPKSPRPQGQGPQGPSWDEGSRYLLREGERSRRHRVDAAEVWHHYAGAPLELMIEQTPCVLGPDVTAGERPQHVVPPGAWQSARSLGAWTLVGCTVSPAFEFEFFELDPEDTAP